MRSMLSLLIVVPILSFGAEALKKRAILFLPDHIECTPSGSATLRGDIAFRWDEDEPLSLGVWSGAKSEKDETLGSIDIFDEKGRRLDKEIFVTLPPIPDHEVIVHKGEAARFGIREMYSTVIFPRPGDYYAIASIEYGLSGKRPVEFTTSKRWFKVLRAATKRDSQ